MNTINYADLMDRVKAAVADSLVSVCLLFLTSSLLSDIENVPDYVRILSFIAIVGLYEPLFVSLFGGTIGHYANGLRVKRASNVKKNILFPLAVIRFGVKVFLGIISLFTVSSNSESKAIHDSIVGSIVIRVK
jgi:uncharacterized RDD family membrane protein YckC